MNYSPSISIFMHMCKTSYQTWCTYVGGANFSKTELIMIVQSLVMNKTRWTSMTSSQSFIAKQSLYIGCPQLPKRGRLKISSLVLIIDVTLWLTLCLSVYLAKGNPSHGWSQVIKKRWMVDPQVMIKCSKHGKEEREKQKGSSKGINQ